MDPDSGTKLVHTECDNYNSTSLFHADVEKQIITEISEGRYKVVSQKPKLISSLGAIPKKDGGIRLIHDCSRPENNAVNDYYCSGEKYSFESVKEAEKLIQPGYYMAKVDLKSAYRSVKIDSLSCQFTGLKWKFTGDSEPTFLVDHRLPFGSNASPGIFHRITQAVKRIMHRKYGTKMVVFLDDFLIVSQNKKDCNIDMLRLISVLRNLGFSISWPKVCQPSTKLIFLGVELDSVCMTVKLPDEKVSEYSIVLAEFLQKARASKRQLQSVAGKLNFAAQVIRGGRCYLRRLITAIGYLKQAHHKAKINADIKADIAWWLNCMNSFNCRNIVPMFDSVQVVRVDASGIGSGYFYDGDWGYSNWESDFPEGVKLHINYKEVLSVLFAVRRWAPCWVNAKVLFGTDSTVAKSVLRKGTCKNLVVQSALREIFWSVKYNFSIEAFHIPGMLNYIPDAISRLHSFNYFNRLVNLSQYYFIDLFPFWSHMSKKSCLFLFQRWRKHCSQKWRTTGPSHLPNLPKKPTVAILNPIQNFVQNLVTL